MINQILVKGSNDVTINGMYKLHKLDNVDDNTLSYYKDEKHQIYRFNNGWKIGHHGKKVYIQLDFCIGEDMNVNEIDVSNIKKDIKHKNFIYILKPVINENSITYHFIINNIKKTVTNKFLTNENIYTGIEGIISIFVPHCILTGKTISSEIPVDKLFLENLQNLVPVFRKWHNNNDLKLNINVPIKSNNKKSIQKKAISTFTMGVDSFYTLYSNIDKIDAILFVIGFDIQIEQKDLLDETIKNLKKVAEIYNKKLILCESEIKNTLKSNTGKGFTWGDYFHGPALFNIAHSLNNYTELIIPSSHPEKFYSIENSQRGSTFLSDLYYSRNDFKISTNGNLSRIDKIKFILNYDTLCLNYLRVCWKNPDQSYNCSQCTKCLRTMNAINLLGHKYNISFKTCPNISDEYKKLCSNNDIVEKDFIDENNIFSSNNILTYECQNLGSLEQFNYNSKKIINEIEELVFMQAKSSWNNNIHIGWSKLPIKTFNGENSIEWANNNNKLMFDKNNSESYKYTDLAKYTPQIKELIEKIEEKFKCTVLLARLSELLKNHQIKPHIDKGPPYFGDVTECNDIYRIHVVLKTNDLCSMMIDKEHYTLEENNLYLTNTNKLHSVTAGSENRYHILLDCIPNIECTQIFKSLKFKTKLCPLKFFRNDVKNNTIVVTFSGLGMLDSIRPRFELIGSLTNIKNNNFDILGVRDLNYSWYISDINSYLSKLDEIIKKYDNVIFIGISSGGFASLLYGKILKVNKIISFSPQTNISESFLNKIKDRRFDKLLQQKVYSPWNNRYYDLNNFEKIKEQEINIIYSSTNKYDEQHIKFIENSCSKIIDIPDIPNNKYYSYGHKVAKFLKEQNKLIHYLEKYI